MTIPYTEFVPNRGGERGTLESRADIHLGPYMKYECHRVDGPYFENFL
jgi:hypothetical protein